MKKINLTSFYISTSDTAKVNFIPTNKNELTNTSANLTFYITEEEKEKMEKLSVNQLYCVAKANNSTLISSTVDIPVESIGYKNFLELSFFFDVPNEIENELVTNVNVSIWYIDKDITKENLEPNSFEKIFDTNILVSEVD